MMRRSLLPRLPKPLSVRIGHFLGVNDLADPAEVPVRFLASASNVRFDKGVASQRPGLALYQSLPAAALPSPVMGLGIWRFVETSGSGSYQVEAENKNYLYMGKAYDALGNPRVAAYVDRLDGNGPADVTPTDATLQGLLLGVDRPWNFAQLGNVLYGVDGFDPMFSWDGSKDVSAAIVPLGILDASMATYSKDFGDLQTATIGAWTIPAVANGFVTAAATARRSDYLHPSHFDTTLGQEFGILASLPRTGTKPNAYAYRSYSSHQDFTAAAFKSSYLYMAASFEDPTPGATTGPLTLLRVHLGKVDPADAASNPATSGSWNPLPTNDLFWDLTILGEAKNTFFALPLPTANDAIGTAILGAVDYMVIEILDQGATATYPVSVVCTPLFFPGDVPTGEVFYRAKAKASSSGVVGPVNIATSVQTFKGPVGYGALAPVGTGTDQNVIQDVCQRVKIVIDWNQVPADTDTVQVFRAVQDPANPLHPPDDTYRLIQEVDRNDPSIAAGLFTFYDNGTDLDIIDLPALQLDGEPPKTGTLAPHFILGRGTSIILARSDDHESRVWKSDIRNAVSVPDVEFSSVAEAGRGGFEDAGNGDGDRIMGLAKRGRQILIFKERSVYVWTIFNEGSADETWDIIPLTKPGCRSSDSICEVPGGVVWLSDDGVYFLDDNAETATRLPISRDLQATIDAIPATFRSLVACAYVPTENLLLVSVPEGAPAGTAQVVTHATNANPIVITTFGSHGAATGDRWGIAGCDNVSANGYWTVTVLSPTTFSLNGSNGTTATAGITGIATPQAVSTALLPLDNRMATPQAPLGQWCGKWTAVTSPGTSWKPGRFVVDQSTLYILRADSGRIDTLKKLTGTNPCTDFGSHYTSSVQTGWLTLLPDTKTRLTRRQFEVEGTAAGDLSSFTVTLETRPGAIVRVYSDATDATYDVTIPADLEAVIGTAAGGDDRTHNDLQGIAHRVTIAWTRAAGQNAGIVKLLGLTLGYITGGPYR